QIDEKPFTYVTRFGERADEAEMVYALDYNQSEVRMYDQSDKMEGQPSAVLTLRRTAEGKLELTNESVWPVQVGTAYVDRERQTGRRGGFTLKNTYQGLKRAFGITRQGNPDDKRRWDSRLTSAMTWKPQSYIPVRQARWQRSQSADLVAA
ncbi:MAG TPA: hypothetical protein VGO07_01550, partial [Candidatus Saccharimonadales bacterium]|nr:hypothetical protein [Candidatus Saccharimonadales bacterium]